MSSKYTYGCCPSRWNSIEGLHSAIPESMRISAGACNPSSFQYSTFVTVPSGDMNSLLTSVPIVAGGPIPYVDVGTTSASATTNQRGLNVVNAATNPYDPATRFSQYVPALPRPYISSICPVRTPSNEPLPSSKPCIPITHFPNSTE